MEPLRYSNMVEAKCPYCGKISKFLSEGFANNRAEIVTCDCDTNSGCGRFYAIIPTFTCTTVQFSAIEAVK